MTFGLSLALALATLIGVALGLLGSGGSIVTLPVLVYVAGIPAAHAVGMSLVIVGGTSAVGSLLHSRQGGFDARAAVFFAVSGVFGAFVGARFTHRVRPEVLLLLFGVLMLAIGAVMLRRNDSSLTPRSCRPLRCLAAGLAVGALTGFLGVGGGMFIVPALVLFAGLDMKKAIGTSLAVIALNCFGGLLGQVRYVDFDWPLTLAFLGVALGGMVAGTALAHRLSGPALRRAFAWAVVGIGLALVARNLMALLRSS
jgi:hypothetical protein